MIFQNEVLAEVSLKKDDWYCDRILWRAKQHNLFNKRCRKFSDLSEDFAQVINEVITKNINPVLVFWENRNKWTVLGTREICSFYNDSLVCSKLGEIDKQVSVFRPPGIQQEEVKTKSNFISLDKKGILIWAPAGAELFALINILQMFPLGNQIGDSPPINTCDERDE